MAVMLGGGVRRQSGDSTVGVFRAHLRQIGADLRHLLLAAVPTERLLRLRVLDPDRYQWVSGSGWPEVGRSDPRQTGRDGGGGSAAGRCRPGPTESSVSGCSFPHLPLLIYTELAPATASVLLQLGRAGIRRVVFHRFEDAPASLRSALQAELEQSASQQVMQALGGPSRSCPGSCSGRWRPCCTPGEDAPTVTALAERAQLTRRTCERWFTKVGLPSPRMVMVLTRLLYAHRLLLDPGYTVEDVALKLGYSKTKTLQMHLRAVFGVTAGELRVSLSTEEALMIVTERYLHAHEPGRLVTARILIVDDEPGDAPNSGARAHRHHYEVVSAADPHSAYQMLDEIDLRPGAARSPIAADGRATLFSSPSSAAGPGCWAGSS